MSDIVEWLRNSNSDEWCSGQLLKAADEIQRLRTELKESRRLFVRDTDEYIKWTDEAKVEIEKLRQTLDKQAEKYIRLIELMQEKETLHDPYEDGINAGLRFAVNIIKESVENGE